MLSWWLEEKYYCVVKDSIDQVWIQIDPID